MGSRTIKISFKRFQRFYCQPNLTNVRWYNFERLSLTLYLYILSIIFLTNQLQWEPIGKGKWALELHNRNRPRESFKIVSTCVRSDHNDRFQSFLDIFIEIFNSFWCSICYEIFWRFFYCDFITSYPRHLV